ncbi:MAG: helix-turn-helix domain-containing protein [Candidatus Aminicenantes bacterium]|nr:helix-turn-helix domain-containing protein [Candidatus Aminicenantes bacterium]
MLTIKQASQFLKLHVGTINQLITEGKIPSYKLGKRQLFDRDELFRWCKKTQGNGATHAEG